MSNLNHVAAGNSQRIKALQSRVDAIVEQAPALTDAQLIRLGALLTPALEVIDAEAVRRINAHLEAKFRDAS
ncbi:MAG TPA: hypothetical protein VHW92_01090 [Mycobacteriales bacterium]|jgi:hypothetical protein|nr:hypothetical protein [Mycobacteriales bacterium]